MHHGLPGSNPVIQPDIEAIGMELLNQPLADLSYEMPNVFLSLRRQFEQSGHMEPRDDQRVSTRDGKTISEGQRMGVGGHRRPEQWLTEWTLGGMERRFVHVAHSNASGSDLYNGWPWRMPMRYIIRLTTVVAVVVLSASLLFAKAKPKQVEAGPAASQDGITVYFSPSGGCTEAVVGQIEKAQKTIRLQAYSFTSAAIAKALVDVHKRGVDIVAVLDKSQRTEKYSGATFLLNEGIPTLIDAKHAIAHNKIILIDGRTIITGSFNFTKAAEESNAENLLIIEGKPELYSAYQRNFDDHLAHSEKYEGLKR